MGVLRVRYRVDHPLDLPSDVAECWYVNTKWNSRGTRYFSSLEEAKTDAAVRLEARLQHPTAGPTVNGKKPHGELELYWQEVPSGVGPVYWGCLQLADLGGAPWPFHTEGVEVHHWQRR